MLTNWPITEMKLHKFRDLRTKQKMGVQSSSKKDDLC